MRCGIGRAIGAGVVALSAGTAFGIVGGQNSAPGSWLGVGRLSIPAAMGGSMLCTGTLIPPKPGSNMSYILTAAHCLFSQDAMGNWVQTPTNQISFNLPDVPGIGGTHYFAQEVYLNGYNPAAGVLGGNDIAVICLGVDLRGIAPHYNFNMGSINPVNPSLTAHKVGYGRSGTGATGDANPAGTKREGTNQVDRAGPVPPPAGGLTDQTPSANNLTAPPNTLLYDFDRPDGSNGPLGGPAGGSLECTTAPGDSGGPMFQYDFTTNEFRITGITSYGSDAPLLDMNGNRIRNGSRFGEIAVDTNVAAFSNWICSVIPAPGTGALVAFGLVAFGTRRRS